ncbi:MAG: hypothetical protein M9894_06455 [Planctomycetes bacterium]|nr:hypothetical protein [Planctomycetota bacterium]
MKLDEAFALADDREAALDHLVPGTEEAFARRCLLQQQRGDLAGAESTLQAWMERHGETSRLRVAVDRQALLRWRDDPAGAREHLIDRLGLSFDHEREVEGEREEAHPTRLDPALLDPDALVRQALSRHGVSGVADQGLERLLDREDLPADRRRQLLARVARPDHPRLPRLIADDLRHPHSRGFGEHPVHRRLTLDQLGELARLVPDLLKAEAFVHTWLARLQPGPDVEWEHDLAAREAYLERLLAFVLPLAPAFNSLKAHVLYHRLELDRRRGVVDRERLVQYLQLPRQTGYAAPEWLREHRDHLANLQADFRQATLLPPVADDEPLVRDLLDEVLAAREDWRPFDQWVREGWLKALFAEGKVLRGLGDRERWTALLGASAYQALRDRVDVVFAPTCRSSFGADELVALDLHVKNAPTLVVKVFELNTLNYALAKGQDVDTTVDLDGLVPTEEQALTLDEPPFRRVARRLELPSLARPGTFVIELIGGGKSSRALVKKGALRHVERVGAAGHAFTVFDEAGRRLPDATLWMAGREYRPDAGGTIHVPFTTSPRRQQVVLRRGELTSLASFDHQAERYALAAGIHVEREALLRRKQAEVLVRAALTVCDVPVSLELLEQPTLVITSTDRQGTRSSRSVPLELPGDREAVYAFQVPEELAEVGFTLTGKVKVLSTGQRLDLASGRTFALNGIDATSTIEDLHLAATDRGWVLHVLGKAGEPRPRAAVTVRLTHREVSDTVDAMLETDARGRVELGALPGVVRVVAERPDGHEQAWDLPREACRLPRVLHGRAGEVLRVPVPGGAGEVSRRTFALLEVRGGGYLRDVLRAAPDALRLDQGVALVRGLEPGDYELVLKATGDAVTLRVTAGEDEAGWVVSRRRLLERARRRPLQVAGVRLGADALTVRVVGATARTRVHVLGARFLPAYPAFGDLDVPLGPEPRAATLSPPPALYVSGRDLGDEYRYVLDRRYAPRRPGVMLARPGLLLNPWAVRDTGTGRQDAALGGGYARARAVADRLEAGAAPCEPSPAAGGAGFANLDFLPRPALVAANLKGEVSADGVLEVSVPRPALEGHGHVRVVAVDPQGLAERDLGLPEVDEPPQDVRLRLSLDPARHYAEKRQVTLLGPGDALVLDDITTSKLEVYDTLSRVHGLFSTLTQDAHLEAFRFVLDWPRLTHDEKCARLSEHGCHELHVFIARKDPTFFEQVVRPHLRNKKDKRFIDRLLLGDDLSAWRRPWAHGQLNVVERVLLAERLDGDERGATARHLGDLLDARPQDRERADGLFRTALQGSALDADDALGFGAAAQAAEAVRSKAAMFDMPVAMTAAFAPPPPPAAPAPAAPRMSAPSRGAGAERKKMAAKRSMKEEAYAQEEACDEAPFEAEAADPFAEDLRRDLVAREEVRQLFRRPEVTKELAENDYYRRPLAEQGPDLIEVNAFWRDFAARDPSRPFLSAHVAEATGSFAEMMLALAVLDLPFEAARPETTYEGARLNLRAAAPALAFHQELRPATPAERPLPVLVSQGYLRPDDRYDEDPDGQTVEKYVAGELLAHVVYTCRVVVTNPSSAHRRLDLLLQIPRGAVPVEGGFVTRGLPLDVSAYGTESVEYSFYFPAPGTFPHYPVHVSRAEAMVAAAEPRTLTVVEEPTTVDTTSWDWVSQRGSDGDVLAFLERHNVEKLDLERVAWRCRDAAFHRRLLELLQRRRVYHDTLWSYGLLHGDDDAAREYLLHQDHELRPWGPWLESPLLTIDPVARRWYEHLEYAPLINARAHALGGERKVLNDRFAAQWGRFLDLVAHRPRPTDADWLAATYYLLLQDRVEDALRAFGKVDPARVETTLQLDYARAYLAVAEGRLDDARAVAQGHDDYPVQRWRDLFRAVLAQVDEAEGRGPAVVDERDHAQKQGALASTEPALELSVENRAVTIAYQNVGACRVNYYLMDVELLFSRQPFVQQQTDQFSFVRPNRTDEVELPPDRREVLFELPAELRARNVIVEVVAGALRRTQAYYAHALTVQVIEQYGQVRVAHQLTGAPLPAVYVKVYARLRGGASRFYKDGYTDLRGRFDYASLSTGELSEAERFAVLVLSDEHGAVIREAAPPKE